MISRKIIRIYFYMIIFISVQSISGQEFIEKTINKGPIYATASILQDYDGDSDLDIIITRRSGLNDNTPSSVEWLENDGTELFPRTTLFEDLSFPVDLDTGDFDGDGNMDYVVSDKGNQPEEGKLALFIKQTDGSYLIQTLSSGNRFDQADVADFNDDGKLDITATGFWQDTIKIFINNGSLDFAEKIIAINVSQIELIEADDIDDDGDTDIIFGGGSDNNFKILYNNGNAIFDSSKSLFTNNGTYSTADAGLVITDLNNDNIKDILTFSGIGSGGLYFLNGAQDYTPSLIDIEGVDLGGDLVVADFDGNGFLDIVRQNYGDDYVEIMYQIDDLEFRKEFIEQSWDNRGPAQMSVGDIDGDGDPDLIFPENGNVDGDLSLFKNIEGKLYRSYLYHEIASVRITKAADIDSDGDTDIVVTAGEENTNPAVSENEIVWYENRGNNNFIEHRIDDAVNFPTDLEIADIDGDNNLDVITCAYNDNELIFYKMNGAAWNRTVIDTLVGNPTGITVADLNADTFPDILLCSEGDSAVYNYINDGFLNFTRQTIDSEVLNPQEIITGDFNGDEDIDFSVSSADSAASLLLFINSGDGNFERSTLSQSQFSYSLAPADWNGDGAMDIIAVFDKGSVIGEVNRDAAVFFNDGEGNFTDSTLIVLNERTRTLKIADIDDDNDPDIILGSAAGIFPLRLAINDNDGRPEVFDITDRGTRVYGIDAADFNEDGFLDIVASDQHNSTNNLLLFAGTGTTDIKDEELNIIPSSFSLEQNYPNPFNPETKISYSISKKSFVQLKIYDALGREIRTIVSELKAPGSYQLIFNSGKLSSGVYFYRMETEEFIETKKMIILK